MIPKFSKAILSQIRAGIREGSAVVEIPDRKDAITQAIEAPAPTQPKRRGRPPKQAQPAPAPEPAPQPEPVQEAVPVPVPQGAGGEQPGTDEDGGESGAGEKG